MKRCIEAHFAKGFGDVTEGALFDDDSPYIGAKDKFEDVPDIVKPAPKKRAPRKFGEHPIHPVED